MLSLARSLGPTARAMNPLAAAALLVALGCGGPAPGRDGGPADGGSSQMDGYVPPDGAIRCQTDADCDDGVSCTTDVCAVDGTCRNGVDPSVCDDGVFCNGVEQCDPTRGCQPPQVRETCNDNDVCTIDHCDESTDSCTHDPRDLDMDGDPDFFCPGGGDCDDRNPMVSSLVNEVCGDGIDNDCDNMVDEADCGRPAHDLCDDALDVSAGGTVTIDTTGATGDYAVSCGSTGNPDVVATFTLDAARSVTLDAQASTDFFNVAASLRTACDDGTTEVACDSGYPGGTIRRRSLDAGTYFVVVASSTPGQIDLTVTFGDPIPPAANDTCDMPTDVSAGGTFMGSFVEVADDVTTSCGLGARPDLLYTFTTTEEQDVRISARAPTGDSLNWSLRTTCTDDSSDLRCVYGGPASGTVHQLPAGTYFLVVEGPTWAEVDFTLDVAFLASSPPPPGDTCGDPLPVTIGTPLTGTLVDKQDDIDVACGFYYRDAVHTFTIDADSDVTVSFNPGGYGNVSIRSACADASTELSCESGSPARARLRNLAAGTYYVIGEASTPSGYTLEVDATTPPTVPVDVSGNDACPDAYAIPATGGLFRGDTSSMTDNYEPTMCGSSGAPDAIFQLDLAASKHVVLSTDSSAFDTVLHVHRDACTSTETYCDDDGGSGTTSLIDQTLDAGTWYVVVDGFSTGSSGQYLLEVTITDP